MFLHQHFARHAECNEGFHGVIVSKITRDKISKIHKGKKQSLETIKKRVLKHKGFKFSHEQKINLARAHMGNRKILCSNGKLYLSAYEASLDTGANQ